MNALTTITQQLAPLFAEQDAIVEARDVDWALGRAEALREFKATDEYRALSAKGAWGGVYDKLFDICGGKTWYGVFNGSSNAAIEEFARKNAQSRAAKRNAKIAAKLATAGVTEVIDAKVGYCRDGFNGWWRINGDRIVSIESIMVGGHNIQRLHQRVLVKVKQQTQFAAHKGAAA